MFDMGWDKLLLVAMLVGLVAGPERLMGWSRSAVQFLGRAREAYRAGKAQVVGELDQFAPDWRSYDPRRMDPRRIIRDALEGGEPAPPVAAQPAEASAAPTIGVRLDPLGERPPARARTAQPPVADASTGEQAERGEPPRVSG
ncbi:Sec-independent protein translocase TatB [Microbacterium sp. LMI1-1-1.1]|uniref:Sec-independent protein translocase TatB n=1 Tax=Microbacterium sp. LMI1-1-1.1 TaxID=3135223 RepID=UPI003466B82D